MEQEIAKSGAIAAVARTGREAAMHYLRGTWERKPPVNWESVPAVDRWSILWRIVVYPNTDSVDPDWLFFLSYLDWIPRFRGGKIWAWLYGALLPYLRRQYATWNFGKKPEILLKEAECRK